MGIKNIMIALSAAFAMLVSGFSTGAQEYNGGRLKLRTVVLDPGHGGKDAGCVSKDRRTYEKNLTLAIAKSLGAKIKEAYPDVRVFYTRMSDKYLTLNERADIANRNHADLFISIHINANTSSSPSGFSAHIFGRSSGKDSDLFKGNMDVCRRENSVILLEDDYTTKYQGFDPNDPESFIFFNLMQNANYEQSLIFAGDVIEEMKGGPIVKNRGVSQDPFFVLWKTTMPSVLLELGFISNTTDLRALNTERGRNEISSRIFEAFKKFKNKYDSSIDYSAVAGSAVHSQSLEKKTSVPAGKIRYGVQVMAVSRKLSPDDKSFKGYEPLVMKSGNIYKYIICVTDSENEAKTALCTVASKFPGAFAVEINGDNISRIR